MKLKSWRTKKKWSRVRMAMAVSTHLKNNIGPTTIQNIEEGHEPSVSKAVAIHRVTSGKVTLFDLSCNNLKK